MKSLWVTLNVLRRGVKGGFAAGVFVAAVPPHHHVRGGWGGRGGGGMYVRRGRI